MATETVTTLDYMAPIDWDIGEIYSKISFLNSLDDVSFLIRHHGGLYTNSMMLSQTAADVRVFEAFLESHPYKLSIIYFIVKSVLARIMKRGNYNHFPIFLDYLRRSLDADYDFCRLAIILRGERAVEGIYKNETCDGALPSQHSQHAFTVAVAAVLHLLAFVFQYLIGYIDRGGTKTYSSGCFDFRASFVSVLLFLAAFVWIKFRQAARPPTGKRKQPEHPTDDANDTSHVYPRKYGSVTKYEARFTIPATMRDEAHPVTHPRLHLGEYKTREEAAFVWRVAETRYEDKRGTCCVTLQGEPYTFPVPAMSEQERGLVGEEKKQWVMKNAKAVGTKEYAKLPRQSDLAPGTGSHDRSPSRRTRQPSLMLAFTAHQPLNRSYAPSCSVPLQPPGAEELKAGSQPFQLEHQGTAQGFEGPVSLEGVDVQWREGQPPPNGMQTEYSHEELMTLCGALANDFTFEQGIPLNSTTLYSDSALLEDDNSHIFGAEAATVEHHQLWPVQTIQQRRDAGDAVEQYADGSGSDPIVVEQSQLVPQFFSVQSREVDHAQGTESQLAEPSQQMSNGWGEPSESIPQRNEPLHKELERLRKEKELCEQEYERLRKEKELCEQENERLRKEKELCEQENERLRKEKELSDEEKERLREENKRLSDAIVVLVAPKSK